MSDLPGEIRISTEHRRPEVDGYRLKKGIPLVLLAPAARDSGGYRALLRAKAD